MKQRFEYLSELTDCIEVAPIRITPSSQLNQPAPITIPCHSQQAYNHKRNASTFSNHS
ncbi:hypothetical protein PPACK8108_LOCUS12100 [Phakopsora pachyrhizi]|uniref:Uncharacterized protein n=1 Tax=Phakopsora pachyrhizi TaxID=170000 RepID=A0AAV0B3A8_PHAPC|nr:hypothetical protein PPACK8108_LOCUS12100 [Phakopsora pachyrhizi]